jgi:hypothetical protein
LGGGVSVAVGAREAFQIEEFLGASLTFKDTNFEGGWRVPCAIRWPGVIKAGTVSNDLFSHTDTCCPPWPLPRANRTSSRN